MFARILLLFIVGCSIAHAQPTVTAPAAAKIGGEVIVNVAGTQNPRDFVTIVPKGSREGSYDAYQYIAKPGAVTLQAPAEPGDYEVRVLGAASPYATLARAALRLESVQASLEAPEQVAAGAPFSVQWTGPNNARDYVAIGDAARPYITYQYASAGSPSKLTAPEAPGEYELRYILGHGDKVIAKRRIVIASVTASVKAPASIAAGSTFAVAWQGPNNARDFITLVKAGAAAKSYAAYQYVSTGNPVRLRAPDEAGAYEVRYLTAQTYATLASTPIAVTAISASITAPPEGVAGESVAVGWQGPNNPHDYIAIVTKGAREGDSGAYAYTARGNPTKVLTPLAAGDYEVRYVTGQSHATLARASLRLTPGKQAPGLVNVTSANGLSAGGAVEIILDASGSMLQKIGSQRRIDIAKQTLVKITSTTIPAGTPFALRVFGREVDSCQTDLDIALAPLDAAAVGAKIGKLEAKNNAKTPIGASLDKVADDLQSVRGERLVIVLTDGEETCGGDPAASIEKLRKAHPGTRISMVGFAIDDAKLAAAFRQWSSLGAGLYFDAQDAAGLNAALTQAMRPAFEIVNATGQTVVEGLTGEAPVKVMPGAYSIRLKGRTQGAQQLVVKSGETHDVRL